MNKTFDIIVIGGGAAGFFTAINAAENLPGTRLLILERGREVLTKVRVSGGGRCNVTHAEFVPKELSTNYPRGAKELLGPFHSFMTGDTIAWFEKRGVSLKIEQDGRIFPVTDSSQTIIDCFLAESKRLGIDLRKNCAVKQIESVAGGFIISTDAEVFETKSLVVATGSNPKIWNLLASLGHTIIPPVPSLFTFHIDDVRINDLPGVSTHTTIEMVDEKGKSLLQSEGPLLITHWGMSGPAILKLSAWGARLLAPLNYQFYLRVNWLYDSTYSEAFEKLVEVKESCAKQTLSKYAQFNLPKRLWQNLLVAAGIGSSEIWANTSNQQLQKLAEQLTKSTFRVHGKSAFKEEFVTAGGVDLKEVNFKTFESKILPHLYFAGEVLNIDAVTGGFNFQNTWTGGYLVAKALQGKG